MSVTVHFPFMFFFFGFSELIAPALRTGHLLRVAVRSCPSGTSLKVGDSFWSAQLWLGQIMYVSGVCGRQRSGRKEEEKEKEVSEKTN